MSSSSDKLVFDLSSETEAPAAVFLKKDFVNLLDTNNGNYSSNQCVIDTSSISNSNKYASYRESFLLVPMLLSVASTTPADNANFAPGVAATSAAYSIGLKNWFGNIFHSLTLDVQGSTVIQQTSFSNMWNSFKLMTTLSWEDVRTQGSTIGFYPDDALTWTFPTADSTNGRRVCNNTNFGPAGGGALQSVVTGAYPNYKSGLGNEGFLRRQQYIAFDPAGIPAANSYASLLSNQGSINMWKSYIQTKRTGVNGGDCGCFQIAISAIVYLKHIHSFFAQMPLLKGIYMRLTLNLNNSSIAFTSAGGAGTAYALNSVSNAVGGVVPIMLASKLASNGADVAFGATTFRANLSVGARCLDSTMTSLVGGIPEGTLARSIYMYVPLYSFNPVFESAYLSSPVKKIDYTDIYQYSINNIGGGNQINSLVTNGIAGIQSVLCIPYHSSSTNAVLTGGGLLAAYQSPFDPAGCGPTSPLALLNNFNVVVSGQNMLYNSVRYGFEEWAQQVYGCNSVNGGMIDGITSGLIGQQDWEMEYTYYYVDCSRMLPVEMAVPKSVSIIGQNQSAQTLDLIVFVNYATSISIDALSGSRV